MPTYEFLCISCNRVSELKLSIKDDTQHILCPVCQEHTAKRQISRSNFVLKGSGFHATDYRQNTTAGTED